MVTDAALSEPDFIEQGDRNTRFIFHLKQDEKHSVAVIASASDTGSFMTLKPITAHVDSDKKGKILWNNPKIREAQ